MKAKKLFFKECHLAGRQYHDADEVWEELHVGTLLELRRDLDNRYDKNAVAVMYNRGLDEDTGTIDEYILGYIPSGENETIAQLLEMGWNDIFECRISKINPEAHYENQVRLTIRIVHNNSKQ
ncbi:MAG: HIRAN domain-containing protein [Bacteroidaceae bacterium]|nr:HIRAN domain-containing protein [Bacteroidaceae bacterium]MBP3832336.1 HIRAN domain-containing protein [Bacteroidaceae bacterium]